MKQSSLLANRKADESGLKTTHQSIIMKALSNYEQLNAEQIAKATGKLDVQQVRKRLSELERLGEVVVVRELPVCVYSMTRYVMPELSKNEYLKKSFDSFQKQAKKFKEILGEDLYNQLINI